jgi:hypothetical protein
MNDAELRSRVWPQFLELYREGGDNIAEIEIAGFDAGGADRLVSLINRHGWIISASELSQEIAPDEFAARFRASSIRRSSETMLCASLCWDAHELWLYCTSIGERGELDLELMYKGASGLLKRAAPEAWNFERFRWFVSIGLSMASAGTARSVLVYEWPIT